MFLLLVLVVVSTFFLLKRQGFGPPLQLRQQPPETEAKRVLAERFAAGEISSDDFLERASVLNWTPGSEAWPTTTGRKRR